MRHRIGLGLLLITLMAPALAFAASDAAASDTGVTVDANAAVATADLVRGGDAQVTSNEPQETKTAQNTTANCTTTSALVPVSFDQGISASVTCGPCGAAACAGRIEGAGCSTVEYHGNCRNLSGIMCSQGGPRCLCESPDTDYQ